TRHLLCYLPQHLSKSVGKPAQVCPGTLSLGKGRIGRRVKASRRSQNVVASPEEFLHVVYITLLAKALAPEISARPASPWSIPSLALGRAPGGSYGPFRRHHQPGICV